MRVSELFFAIHRKGILTNEECRLRFSHIAPDTIKKELKVLKKLAKMKNV